MNVRSRQMVRLLLLLVAIALPQSGAAQLNPTVKVLPQATTPVPPECAEGLAAQTIVRLPADERDFVIRETARDLVPPPSATLRGELQKAFEAARQNDRDAFRTSLGFAKKIVANYPPGGERTAAENTIAVLDDIDTLWDFLFTSPTGAFFDAGSDVYRTMSKYSGYETFIRRQTIVDQNGVKFYPMVESRDFLLQESSERYAQLTGKRLPIAPPAPRAVVVPPPPPPPKTTHIVTTPKPAPKPVHKEARATEPRPVRRTAHHKTTAPAKPAAVSAVTTTHVEKEAPTRVAPPPVTASELPPATATSTTAPATTTEAAPATTTTAEPSASTTTTTTAAAPTTETTTTEPVKKPEPKRRNFLVPALLILIGIGVLVVLVRASS